MKHLYANLVTAGMFMTRMFLLAVMALLQRLVGGAEIRPPHASQAASAAN